VLDFSNLGEEFFSPIKIQSLSSPFLIHKNQALYDRFGLDMNDTDLLKVSCFS